jgi:hypothetical protein
MSDKKGAEDRQVAGDDSEDHHGRDGGVGAYGNGYSKIATDNAEDKDFVIDIGGKKDSAAASMLEVNGTGMVKRAEGGS